MKNLLQPLIVPDFAYLQKWCEQKGIVYTTKEDIILNSEITSVIQKEVSEINKSLGQVEEIKRFRLIADEWSPETGEMSPTLKLKRNVIAQKYSNIIEEIFTPAKTEEGIIRIKMPRINLSLSELINKLRNGNMF